MNKHWAKALATIAVSAAGGVSMWITADNTIPTGIGWAILGTFLIWASD